LRLLLRRPLHLALMHRRHLLLDLRLLLHLLRCHSPLLPVHHMISHLTAVVHLLHLQSSLHHHRLPYFSKPLNHPKRQIVTFHPSLHYLRPCRRVQQIALLLNVRHKSLPPPTIHKLRVRLHLHVSRCWRLRGVRVLRRHLLCMSMSTHHWCAD
jgi:hypothetical protein